MYFNVNEVFSTIIFNFKVKKNLNFRSELMVKEYGFNSLHKLQNIIKNNVHHY